MDEVNIDLKCHSGESLPVNAKKQSKVLWLCYCKSIHIRTFHISWWGFFICFFGWFGTANLSKWIEKSIDISIADKTYAAGSAVASTVLFRILVGEICDGWGPRKTFTLVLILSSIPIMGVGLVTERFGYIIIHFFIGLAGASFVITQYHCTRMFSSEVVGTANATSAGWGNIGGGSANFFMPLLLKMIVYFSDGDMTGTQAWRYTFLIPGILMIITGIVYYFFTIDDPRGNFDDIRHTIRSVTNNILSNPKNEEKSFCGKFYLSLKKFVIVFIDYRVFILFLQYAACFGMEITVLRFTVEYLQESFNMSALLSGFVVLLFSMTDVVTRTIGGVGSDYLASKLKKKTIKTTKKNNDSDIKGRVYWLFWTTLLEGIFLIFFAFGTFNLIYTIVTLVLFSFFVQAAEGATYSVTPFILPDNAGSVAGIVGAGGNFGATIFAFCIFRFVPHKFGYMWAHFILGIFVCACAFLCLLIKIIPERDLPQNKEIKLKKLNTTENSNTCESDYRKIDGSKALPSNSQIEVKIGPNEDFDDSYNYAGNDVVYMDDDNELSLDQLITDNNNETDNDKNNGTANNGYHKVATKQNQHTTNNSQNGHKVKTTQNKQHKPPNLQNGHQKQNLQNGHNKQNLEQKPQNDENSENVQIIFKNESSEKKEINEKENLEIKENNQQNSDNEQIIFKKENSEKEKLLENGHSKQNENQQQNENNKINTNNPVTTSVE